MIRQLDARLDLLGPSGRGGTISAASLQLMHRTIYQILRDTGRRPGEVVSLRTGCVEVTGGQHNLIYDNHKAGRKRRRLPVTSGTAGMIAAWQQHRAQLRVPPELDQWLFPSPLLRARQSRGHISPAAVARAFKEWTAKIGVINSDLAGPDGSPAPFDPALITPYALRHSYAQRHADAGVPVDVLRELMDHAAISTTMGYYQISLKRKQQAIRSVGPLAADAAGNPAPFASATAYERASVAVPFGNCTEPSNVKAGGGSCPIRFQCAGCGSTAPTLPTCPPSSSTSPACAPTSKPPARWTPPDTCWTASRRDQLVHRRRGEDARLAVPAGPRPARRGRTGQQTPAPRPGSPDTAADRHHRPPRGDRMTTATSTRAMLAARAHDSQDKRHRALDAIRALEATGTPVTATAVAAAAGVSTWLAYADGVREHVQAARGVRPSRTRLPSPLHLPAASRSARPACARTSP